MWYHRSRAAGETDIVRKNIALVDDDRNILTSVSMLLEAEGFPPIPYQDVPL